MPADLSTLHPCSVAPERLPRARSFLRSSGRVGGILAAGLLLATASAALVALPPWRDLAYADARGLAVREDASLAPRYEIHQALRASWTPLRALGLPIANERIVVVDRETFVERCAAARPAARVSPTPRAARELLFIFTGERGDPLWTRHRVERFEAESSR